MKIKILFIGGILLISSQSFSQSFFGGIMERIHFGVKAGANYSDFTNANFNTEGLVGFHAGAIIEFKISDSFSVEEEFLYSQQGAKLKGGLMDGKAIKLTYVTVPIMVKYKTSFGLYLEAGPQVGILIDEDFKAIGVSDDGDFAEQIDAGIVGGLGYQFNNGLGLGVRYYRSFTDVSKIATAGIKPDFQNNAVQASIFYIF